MFSSPTPMTPIMIGHVRKHLHTKPGSLVQSAMCSLTLHTFLSLEIVYRGTHR
jgi:hypothetical protein